MDHKHDGCREPSGPMLARFYANLTLSRMQFAQSMPDRGRADFIDEFLWENCGRSGMRAAEEGCRKFLFRII